MFNRSEFICVFILIYMNFKRKFLKLAWYQGHNIFIKRIGFSLIRVHREQTLSATTSTAEVLLQQLKWPIETLFVGMKLRDYNSSTVALRREHLDKWHSFAEVSDVSRAQQGVRSGKVKLINATYTIAAGDLLLSAGASTYLKYTGDTTTLAADDFPTVFVGDILSVTIGAFTKELVVSNKVVADGTNKGYLVFDVKVSDVSGDWGTTAITEATLAGDIVQYRPDSAEPLATVQSCAKTIDTLTIKAHGIPIYNAFPSQFYNAYVPYHYGGPNVKVPEDCGALMVNFCLYPGTYQPSGHINVSRAREFYLEYSSSVISSSVVGTLVVVASAINFLLISDGSAVLRYST